MMGGDVINNQGTEEGSGASLRYGDREDEVEFHNLRPRDEDKDEEAQLLDGEDYEQFELDEVAHHSPEGNMDSCHGLAPTEDDRKNRWRITILWMRFMAFLAGPAVPRPYTIRPIFPAVQEAPVRLLNRIFPRHWQILTLLMVVFSIWPWAFAVLLNRGKGALTDAVGNTVVHMDCLDSFWRRNNECGLDGIDCQPFTNQTMTFRCPATCADAQVPDLHHVGPIDVHYQSMVIGGPVYRGDSLICASAIHAGVIDDATGGCGTVNLIGDYYSFFSSNQNGIESIGFDSYFPLSYNITNAQCGDKATTGKDPRDILLILSLLSTIIFSIFTTSPSLFFFTNFIAIFIHVALVSDPPPISGLSDTILPSLVSTVTARLLPALFVATILYYTCAKHTLTSVPQVEKTMLYLFPLWFGALSDFDWIPLPDLSMSISSDMMSMSVAPQPPGAIAALVVIGLLLAILISIQNYHFWREGRLMYYINYYHLVVMIPMMAPMIPGVEFRFHRYILALSLLPITSLQTRPSLLYQGLLLGLFISGVARWGLESMLQPPAAAGSRSEMLFPEPLAPLIYIGDQLEPLKKWSISFKWADIPPAAKIMPDGISVLVNDVERYRGFFTAPQQKEMVFTWMRERVADAAGTPEYFRFAYVLGGKALDYSGAGTWFVNGSWSQGEGYFR